MPVLQHGKIRIDFNDAGSGDPVVLVHSSVSGKRQWKHLTQELQPHFRVLALNLFGYGETSAWNGDATQTITDQAGLVLALLQDLPGPVRIVGHSFGAAVACQAATLLGSRASHLFLFEPTLFQLLAQDGCRDAHAEAMSLRDFIKHHGQRDDWTEVAERFVDYWLGDGGWAATPEERRQAYMQLLRPNQFEWDCLASDRTTLEDLAALRARAMIAYSPAARRPIREIVGLIESRCPNWSVARIAEGGHMAPLTHPQVVNPLIADFLRKEQRTRPAQARLPCSARDLSLAT